MTVLHLVRHGRTALNAQGRFRGHQDPELDDQGRVDATRAADALASEAIAIVTASPLRRAQQTAAAVAAGRDLTVGVEPGLADIDYGRWEGRTYDEARADDDEVFGRLRNAPRSFVPPGGEPMTDVEERALAALDRLRAGPSPAVAVSHDVPIRVLVTRIAGIPEEGFWAFPLVTGGIVDLRHDGEAWSLTAVPGGPGYRGDLP
ncbi:MAG: histidine phosphatase family protein [Actinomycetota bacterium]